MKDTASTNCVPDEFECSVKIFLLGSIVCQDNEKARSQKNKGVERTGWHFGEDQAATPPWIIEPIQNARQSIHQNENFRG